MTPVTSTGDSSCRPISVLEFYFGKQVEVTCPPKLQVPDVREDSLHALSRLRRTSIYVALDAVASAGECKIARDSSDAPLRYTFALGMFPRGRRGK